MSSPARCLTCGVTLGAIVDTLGAGFSTLVKGDGLGVFGGVGLLAVAADARVGESILESINREFKAGVYIWQSLQRCSYLRLGHLRHPVAGREVGRRLAGRHTISLSKCEWCSKVSTLIDRHTSSTSVNGTRIDGLGCGKLEQRGGDDGEDHGVLHVWWLEFGITTTLYHVSMLTLDSLEIAGVQRC